MARVKQTARKMTQAEREEWERQQREAQESNNADMEDSNEENADKEDSKDEENDDDPDSKDEENEDKEDSKDEENDDDPDSKDEENDGKAPAMIVIPNNSSVLDDNASTHTTVSHCTQAWNLNQAQICLLMDFAIKPETCDPPLTEILSSKDHELTKEIRDALILPFGNEDSRDCREAFDLEALLRVFYHESVTCIKKNEYSDDAKLLREKDKNPEQCCQTTCKDKDNADEPCFESCVCRIAMAECNDCCIHSQDGKNCGNRRIQTQPYKKLEIRDLEKTNKLTGKKIFMRSVVTKEAIKKGDCIIEHVGEVSMETKPVGEPASCYDMKVNNSPFIINAFEKGNSSRFINHSCEPNCEVEVWQVNCEPRCIFVATKDIEVDEELTYDYKWGSSTPYECVLCFCGSEECRTTINTAVDYDPVYAAAEASVKRRNFAQERKKRKSAEDHRRAHNDDDSTVAKSTTSVWHPDGDSVSTSGHPVRKKSKRVQKQKRNVASKKVAAKSTDEEDDDEPAADDKDDELYNPNNNDDEEEESIHASKFVKSPKDISVMTWEERNEAVDNMDDNAFQKHCRTMLMKDDLAKLGEREYVQRCKNALEKFKISFPGSITEVDAKNDLFKQKGIKCEVVEKKVYLSSQNLGNNNTKTLKSCIYVTSKGAKMNSGEFLVAGCGNNECLNPSHYGKKGVRWDATVLASASVAVPAPAPAPTPRLDPTATLRSALRPASSLRRSRQKDAPKPGCYSSLKCPICKCEFHQDGLRFRWCDCPETCGPWEKTCEVCKSKEQE